MAKSWDTTGNAGINPAKNFLGTTDGQPVIIKTDAAGPELLHVGNSGNVGIGNGNPNQKLNVSGNESTPHGFDASIGISNTAAQGGNWYLRCGAFNTATPPGGLSIADDQGYRMVFDNAGHVGCGTTKPAAGLHIQGSSNFQFPDLKIARADVTDEYARLRFEIPIFLPGSRFGPIRIIPQIWDMMVDDSEFSFFSGVAGSGGGTGKIMSLISDGTVGIGTDSPEATLNVVSSDHEPQIEIVQNTFDDYARLRFISTGQAQVIEGTPPPPGRLPYWDIAVGGTYSVMNFYNQNVGNVMTLEPFDGNVGIGTTTPAFKLDVNGTANVSGDTSVGGNTTIAGNLTVNGDILLPGADLAEEFELGDEVDAEPGCVMVMNEVGRLRMCDEPYDTKAVGVVSGAGTFRPAITLDKRGTAGHRMALSLVGKAFCKVDCQYGKIRVGDLLTTSPTTGHAMRASDANRAFGAVVGKAMQPLDEGRGLIPILISLR